MDRLWISRIASLALAASLIVVASPARAAPASVADRIAAAVARVMDYPRDAREEEGVVVVGFVVGGGGAAEGITLVAGSGHPLLDQAALRAMTRLHDLPAEAAGRRSLALLQYRVGGPGRDPVAARSLRTAVDQLRSRRPDALLSASYSR